MKWWMTLLLAGAIGGVILFLMYDAVRILMKYPGY